MNNNAKSIITTSAILVGSVIGAGFATGREIVNFFGIYGRVAPGIILVVGVLFFWGIRQFLLYANARQNKALEYFFDSLIFVAIFIVLSTMISGLKSINDIFFPKDYLLYIFLFISYLFIVAGVKGLSLSNVIITPILVLSLVIVSVLSISFTHSTFYISQIPSTLFSRSSYFLFYMGLNLFTNYPICKTLGKDLSKKQINIISLVSSLVLTILIMVVYLAIMLSGESIYSSDIPLALLALTLSPGLGIVYYIIIVLAIITTLITCGFVLQNYNKSKKINNFLYTFLLMSAALVVSKIGFGMLVKFLYPLIGVFGIIFLLSTINVAPQGQRSVRKIIKKPNQKLGNIQKSIDKQLMSQSK